MGYWKTIKSVQAKAEAAGYTYERLSREDLRAVNVDAAKQGLYVVTAMEQMLGVRRYQEPTDREMERARREGHDQQMQQQFDNLRREMGGDVELLDPDVSNYIRRTKFGLPELCR
ncbi:MAG: hypothetical protein HQL20_11435 [Candidatus Omnitrophica bacterium]|nr:hypothetical protein [Candidatus Omnitrophota bacterium]